MPEPIEGEYFIWLCAKVVPPHQQYYDLLRILYTTEFVWLIQGDRNREEDGLELRQYFLTETGMAKDRHWFELPCSILEMLIAFAERAYFQTETSTKDWFWTFISNLDLGEYRHLSDEDVPIIEERLRNFIYRTYDEGGQGGMFPMQWPQRDQRKVEIWYQFCEYLDDRGLM